MLKSIKAITSVVRDSMEIGGRIKSHFDERKKRKLAQTLHLVYLRLNDCIATGEQIIDVLDRFVRDPSQIGRSRKYFVCVDGPYLEKLLRKQEQHLESLGDSLDDYSEIIRALDAELYIELRQFVAFKGVGVGWLAVLLSRGMIPFDALDLDDVKRLAEFSDFMKASEQDVNRDIDPLEDAVVNFLPWYSEVGVISRRLDANSFEIDALFDHDEEDFDKAVDVAQLERLSDFLRRNDLREHLLESKENMKAIKEFLENNFSTVELMLDVGSEQLKKKTEW